MALGCAPLFNLHHFIHDHSVLGASVATYDERCRAVYSGDTFGRLQPEPHAQINDNKAIAVVVHQTNQIIRATGYRLQFH